MEGKSEQINKGRKTGEKEGKSERLKQGRKVERKNKVNK